MTNKEKVIKLFPKACSERHQTRNPFNKEYYWLIWSSKVREEKIRLGEGSTEAKAWKDAWEKWNSQEQEIKTEKNE